MDPANDPTPAAAAQPPSQEPSQEQSAAQPLLPHEQPPVAPEAPAETPTVTAEPAPEAQAQPAPSTAAAAAAAPAVPAKPAHASDVEAAVMTMLDVSGPEKEKRVPLRELQRACAKLPLLSTTLTAARRFKLYVQLLLDEGEVPAPVPAETFLEAAPKASEAHRAVAVRIAAVFPSGHFASQAAVEGFVYVFAAETGYHFGVEENRVMVTMAQVVAGGALASGAESLHMLLHLMKVVAKDFMTSNASRLYDGATVYLLRLLLQYQDPVLSAHLDQHKIAVGALLLRLTRSLFVQSDDQDDKEAIAAALAIWDWVFVLGDPVLVPYVAVSLLTAARQGLLSLTDTAALEAALASFSVALPNDRAKAMDPKLVDGRSVALVPVWSGKSLCQNADLIFRSTPQSAQRVLEFCLYPESGSINKTPQALEEYYAGAPVLPLERSDIANSFALQPNPLVAQLEYVMVDCRSQGSYEYARLPTAVLVGDVIGYDAARLVQVVERLRPSKGFHLSIFGTGRALLEEVNLLKLVALHLLRNGFPFISITTGGFKSVIPLIRANTIRITLNNGQPLADGEQHSLLAGLPSKITELRDAYLPTDTEAAKARAAEIGEDLREKAKEGMSTATLWGWGLLSKAQERLSTAREAAAAAVASVGTAGATTAAPAPATAAGGAGVALAVAAAATTSGSSASPAPLPSHTAAGSTAAASAPLQGRVAPPAPAVQIFTLDEGEGDDDFDLITAVPPPRPMKGTVLPPEDGADAKPTEAPAPVSASTSAAASAAPAVQEPRKEEAQVPLPEVPPATSAASAAAPPTAAQIAASIDKEFDDLFGS